MKKKDKAREDANVAENKSDADSDFSLTMSHTTSHPDAWILDSGCTYHMTPVREWFFDFKELDGGVVYMGDDNTCKIKGIGSIKLRNDDGSTKIVRNVRYIPNMKKNLISLGALESKGLHIRMENGILKVVSRALVMLKATRKSNNMYYYQGSS